LHGDRGASPGRRVNRQHASQALNPFSDIPQTHPATWDLIRIESATIIANFHYNPIRRAMHGNRNMVCLAMLQGVVEGLGDNEEEFF